MICPSAYVAESLRQVAGDRMPPVSVIPYGARVAMEKLPPGEGGKADHKPFALFVGNGIQRKGIHYLLHLWEKSEAIRRRLDLVIVARQMDPALSKHFNLGASGLSIKQNIAGPELTRLMRQASFLINPSLLEGFGHVYLEALMQGLPVIGTARSFLGELTDCDQVLIWNGEKLEELESLIHVAIRRFVETPHRTGPARQIVDLTWDSFEKKLQGAIAQLL